MTARCHHPCQRSRYPAWTVDEAVAEVQKAAYPHPARPAARHSLEARVEQRGVAEAARDAPWDAWADRKAVPAVAVEAEPVARLAHLG